MNERSCRTLSTRRGEVGAASEGIDEPSEVGRLQGDRHRVDREITPEEVVAQPGSLDRGQRSGRVVELGAGRDDVDALAVAVADDRGPELSMRRDSTPERGRERVRELDGIAFDRDVDVEALLLEENVANRPADEVDRPQGDPRADATAARSGRRVPSDDSAAARFSPFSAFTGSFSRAVLS